MDAEAVSEAKATLKGHWALAMEDNLQRAGRLAAWSSALPAGETVPDYQASIDAVHPEDLSWVVNTYCTPERTFVGQNLPAVTVASGAGGAGAAAVLALATWGARRLWRWNRRRREEEKEIE